jgi:hypothetical protein
MILWLKARPDVSRIFIEPYLADRLGSTSKRVSPLYQSTIRMIAPRMMRYQAKTLKLWLAT